MPNQIKLQRERRRPHCVVTSDAIKVLSCQKPVRLEIAQFVGSLQDAAQDATKRFPRGQKAEDELQERCRSVQTLCLNPAANIEWRLVYMLMDAGTPGFIGDYDLRIFSRAIFYVGKGTEERSFEHLKEAKDRLLKPDTPRVGT